MRVIQSTIRRTGDHQCIVEVIEGDASPWRPSRGKRAKPSKRELDYLSTLVENEQPVTTKGSQWARK